MQMALEGPQKLGFTIPLMEPLPPQYYIRLVSDNWLQVSVYVCIYVCVCVGGGVVTPGVSLVGGAAECMYASS